MMRQMKFRWHLAALGSLVIIMLVGISVLIYPTSAIASDDPITLEMVWKTDPSEHPIMNGCAIAVDGLGNLYSTDHGADGHTYQVVKFDNDGKFVTAWGENGSGQGQFNWRPAKPEDGPDGGFIAADAEGSVYVSDGYNFRVQKFDPNGEYVLEWGTMGEEDGQFVPPVVGPTIVDPEGNVYVSDFAHVQKFDSEGKFLSTFGSFGTKEGEFQGAAQVAWDSPGNLYVADLLNARYEKFDSEGNFIDAIGTSGDGDGEFYWPLYVAVDQQDRVFVSDNTNRLQSFDTEGNFLASWTDPEAGEAFESVAVIIDSEGSLYGSYYRKEDGCTFYKFHEA